MASIPTASRFTVDATEEIRVTGGGGAGSNVNITGINGTPPALSNPLPVELSDGTNPFGTAGNPLSVNVLSGGGATIGNPVPLTGFYDAINVGGTLRGHTGLSVGAQFAASVAIVDGAGNQITTFGGGTQYAEGTVVSPATGTAMLARAATGALTVPSLDSSGNLKVSIGGQSSGPFPLEFILEDPETNSPARIDDDGNQLVSLAAVALPPGVAIPTTPYDTSGNVLGSTASALVTKQNSVTQQVTWNLLASPTISFVNVANYSTVTLTCNFPAGNNNGTANVLVSNDGLQFAPISVFRVDVETWSGGVYGAFPVGAAGPAAFTYQGNCSGFKFVNLTPVASLNIGSVSITMTLSEAVFAAQDLVRTVIAASLTEPLSPFGPFQSVSNSPCLASGMYVTTQAAGNNAFVGLRTPAIFKTVQASAAGNTAVWTPAAAKKFRLMRYQLILTDNAATNANGVITLSFSDATTGLNISTDFYVQSGIGGGAEFIGPWVDLGNGYLSLAANNVLNASLSTALTNGNFRINVCGTEE